MKNKSLKLISKLLLIGLLLVPVTVFADEDEREEYEPGQLLIDSDAIHEGREVDHTQVRSIGYEVAPFLFLEDMTRIELIRTEYNEAFMASARDNLFLGETPNTGLDTEGIVATLFGDEEDRVNLNLGTRTHMGYFHVPTWLWVVGGIVLTGFLVYVAFILGKKLGNVIHRKKEDEASG